MLKWNELINIYNSMGDTSLFNTSGSRPCLIAVHQQSSDRPLIYSASYNIYIYTYEGIGSAYCDHFKR